MSSHGQANKTRLCPDGHENPLDSSICRTCHLPILDYDAELAHFLRALAAEERHLSFSRSTVFIGVGHQGCELVREMHGSWSEALTDSEFLIIDSSANGRESGAEPIDAPAAHHRLPRLSRHVLPEAPNRQVGYFGLGEQLAVADPHLDDLLLRSGIRPASNSQTVVVVSDLGGGTGSGAAPNIIQRAKALNPHSRSLVVAMMPSADEPDSAHFNAFCSLSRLLSAEAEPLADIILLADNGRLGGIRGIGASGEELAGEALLTCLLATLAGAGAGAGPTEADPSYLARMSSSMGIQAFVPCLAVGRSLEIFGTLEMILDSALASSLAPVDPASVMLSYILVQVPGRMAASLHEKTLRAQLNRWNRERFPRLKGSALQLSQSGGTSDRVDIYMMLGGTKIAVTANAAEKGFQRFKSVVSRQSWEQEFGVTSATILEIENVVSSYDSKLDEVSN